MVFWVVAKTPAVVRPPVRYGPFETREQAVAALQRLTAKLMGEASPQYAVVCDYA